MPPVTDEEVRRHVVSTRRDIQEIRMALVGNKFGMKGVIPRLDEVEAKTERHDRKLLVWGAILTAAGTVLVFIKDFIHSPKA